MASNSNLNGYTIVMSQSASEASEKLRERLVAIRDGEQIVFGCCVIGRTPQMKKMNDATGRSIKPGAVNLYTTDGRYLPVGNLWNSRATSLSNGSRVDPTTAIAQEGLQGVPEDVLTACKDINASSNGTRLDNYLHNVGLPDDMSFVDASLNNPEPIVATMRRYPTGAVGDAGLGLREWYLLIVDGDATTRLRDKAAAAAKAADATKSAAAADIAKIKSILGNFDALDSLNAAQAAAWLAII
jgi:hypothetical protein